MIIFLLQLLSMQIILNFYIDLLLLVTVYRYSSKLFDKLKTILFQAPTLYYANFNTLRYFLSCDFTIM